MSVLFTRRGPAPAYSGGGGGVSGTVASDLEVGSSVFLNVNGALEEFLIVHQGKPSSLYDASCDGTWLMMKIIYEQRALNSADSGNYSASTIHSYLNGGFLAMFDSDVQNAIQNAKIPYVSDTESGAIASGSNGLSAKVFLLGGYEIGYTGGMGFFLPADGACLSYFSGVSDSVRKAYLRGNEESGKSSSRWWIRTQPTEAAGCSCLVGTSGGISYLGLTQTLGIRPALILPSNAVFDPDTMEFVGVGDSSGSGTSGKSASEYAVGDSVFLEENGTLTEYLVVQQGNPNTSLYDNSCDGTWLLRKGISDFSRQFNNYENTAYAESIIHTRANEVFASSLSEKVQAAMKTVKIPYTDGDASSTVHSGSSGLSAKAFSLSGYEVGYTTIDEASLPVDGACLDYFKNASDADRIAYYNTSACIWWLRSPYTTHSAYVWCIDQSGAIDSMDPSEFQGLRPCIILDSSTKFDPGTRTIL